MIAALLALSFALAPDTRAAAQQRPRSVLVVTQSHGTGAFFGGIFEGLRATLDKQSNQTVTLFRENVEVLWSPTETFSENLLSHVKAKYGEKPFDVIVAIGGSSLCYAIRMHEQLWPGIPIVFGLVDQATYRDMKLPPNATGTIMNFGMADMVRAARAVVPNLRRVALVGDKEQPVFHFLDAEIPSATQGLELIDLRGLPISDVRSRVSKLPDDTAILYTAIYSDGRGMRLGPPEALTLVAEAANRPIVVATENLVGRGIGGFVLDPATIGQRAGALVLGLLAGEGTATLPVSSGYATKPVFDWGQLQRWKVDLNRLPPDSVILNRPQTIWEQHGALLWATAAAFLALGWLVIVLFNERRIRLAAQVTASERMSELAHINRYATAGEMSAAIAHELNQPLGAILNNAETAAILLDTKSPDVNELKALVAEIRRDDERAGEIIRRLRALVSKRMVDFEPADLNTIASDALGIANLQARIHGITLHNDLAVGALPVNADPVHLQQVILNLAINAIEATNERQVGPRDIVVRTTWSDNFTAEFLISDFGPGIPPDRLGRIFDPFFTTKPNGMGMGLSLARTIIDAHGGKLWAENAVSGGAVFRFRVPLALTPERG
jgi:signal transduction histidine kinase